MVTHLLRLVHHGGGDAAAALAHPPRVAPAQAEGDDAPLVAEDGLGTVEVDDLEGEEENHWLIFWIRRERLKTQHKYATIFKANFNRRHVM